MGGKNNKVKKIEINKNHIAVEQPKKQNIDEIKEFIEKYKENF